MPALQELATPLRGIKGEEEGEEKERGREVSE